MNRGERMEKGLKPSKEAKNVLHSLSVEELFVQLEFLCLSRLL